MDIPRSELKDWMNGVGTWSHRPPIPVGYRPAVVTLYNYAIDEDDIPTGEESGALTRQEDEEQVFTDAAAYRGRVPAPPRRLRRSR